ncbi:MAG: hypothetical protein AB1414_04140 [bacterium]
MNKIVIWIGLILMNYIPIGYTAPIDPYILEYRIADNNQVEPKPSKEEEKIFSLNIQPVSSDDLRIKIDFKQRLGNKINGELYGNLGSKGHILEAQAKLKIEKEKFTLSAELAHLNQTPLMKKSLFGKVSFIFLPSSILGSINQEGKINIGWLHLPSLYSRYTRDRDGTDLVGVGSMWRFYTKPYEITPDFLFKSELKLAPHLFSELPDKDYDEDIVWAFSDFPVSYSLNLSKKFSQKYKVEMDYQGNINLSFSPWGIDQIPLSLSHGVVSKIDLKPTESLLFQLSASFPFEVKKISYSNPNASFMSKEILGNLEFMGKNGWNFRVLSDYDYEKNWFEETTFSISKRFNSLDGGIYYTTERKQSSQHTIGIYLSTSGKTNYSNYNLTRYEEFPPKVLPVYQQENMQWLKGKGFEETVAALDTPEKISSYMDQFFSYYSEDRIIPQTPRETFEKKRGDCDDQARFATYVLTQHGYEAYVLCYAGRRVGHGISVYKDYNGKWNAIEYGDIFYAQADNPEELITKIEPAMIRYVLFKPDDNYEVKSYLQSQTFERIINWFWSE